MTNDKLSIARKAARRAGISRIVLTINFQSLHLPKTFQGTEAQEMECAQPMRCAPEADLTKLLRGTNK
jgi:hypothetical protein